MIACPGAKRACSASGLRCGAAPAAGVTVAATAHIETIAAMWTATLTESEGSLPGRACRARQRRQSRHWPRDGPPARRTRLRRDDFGVAGAEPGLDAIQAALDTNFLCAYRLTIALLPLL